MLWLHAILSVAFGLSILLTLIWSLHEGKFAVYNVMMELACSFKYYRFNRTQNMLYSVSPNSTCQHKSRC